MNKFVLSVSNVAEMLGVSNNTVYVMVRNNEIPHFKARGRVLFNIEVLEAWTREESLNSLKEVKEEVEA